MAVFKKNNVMTKLLTTISILFIATAVQASRIHFQKLDTVISSAKVICVARVNSIITTDEDNYLRKFYQITPTETLVGNVKHEPLIVIVTMPALQQTGTLRESPLIPSSGIEFNLEVGEQYIFLFSDVTLT